MVVVDLLLRSSIKPVPFFDCAIARLAAVHIFLKAEIARHALTDLRWRKDLRYFVARAHSFGRQDTLSVVKEHWTPNSALTAQGSLHRCSSTRKSPQFFVPFDVEIMMLLSGSTRALVLFWRTMHVKPSSFHIENFFGKASVAIGLA